MLDIHIRFARGDFVVNVQQKIESSVTGLFGPSGSGKSTLLGLPALLLLEVDKTSTDSFWFSMFTL